MSIKLFFEKITNPSEDEKAFSVIAKIIIIGVLLSILLMTIIIYSRNLNKVEESNTVSKNSIVETPQVIENQAVDKEKLISEYKKNLTKILEDFDGDYENTKNKITSLDVPAEFQKIHFELVTALDGVSYGNEKEIALEKIQAISQENDWLSNPLDKILNSLK